MIKGFALLRTGIGGDGLRRQDGGSAAGGRSFWPITLGIGAVVIGAPPCGRHHDLRGEGDTLTGRAIAGQGVRDKP